jgi:tRNA G18 (ribose-2'-O)-methylase SpoU
MDPSTETRLVSPAAGRRLDPGELKERRPSAEQLSALPRRPVTVVLENIRSLGNVGSIFRSADGVRFEQLLLCGFTGHPPRPEIDKTALGADASVPWSYWSQSKEALLWLKDSGYQILGLELTTRSRPLRELRLRPPIALLLGHEVEGISDEALALCDGAVEIPMQGMKESLNVAVAFGVIAYQLAERLPL